MDRLVKRWDRKKDDDLAWTTRGVAYQRDMTKERKAYDATYLANYDTYAQGPIATALNNGRCALLMRHASPEASVLDVGAASGSFIRCARSWGFPAMGYDVINEANDRLASQDMYATDPALFDVVTMWDSIEHMDEPESVLGRVQTGGILLAAVPIMDDLTNIRQSKHFKPGEHLYYFTERGFIDWMALYGFRLLEVSTHETDAGRESIGAFAFCKDLPRYRAHIDAYKEMHASRYYGASATELHLDSVAKIVHAMHPRSIIDFGCGRSDIVAHFWRDGERRIARYDPAIPGMSDMPDGEFDLALCLDVMEHIPMASVDKVLRQVRTKSPTAFFTISTKLARARLPDGRNAHVTLLTRGEWTRWIEEYFGPVETLPGTEHELVLLAGHAAEMRKAA